MKYIITENKMNDLIEKVLKKNEPEIIDIEFSTRKIKLGSELEGYKIGDIIDKTIIKVTIDNMDKRLKYSDISDIYQSIKNTLNSYLNINLNDYGALYDLELYAIEKIKKLG